MTVLNGKDRHFRIETRASLLLPLSFNVYLFAGAHTPDFAFISLSSFRKLRLYRYAMRSQGCECNRPAIFETGCIRVPCSLRSRFVRVKRTYIRTYIYMHTYIRTDGRYIFRLASKDRKCRENDRPRKIGLTIDFIMIISLYDSYCLYIYV